jgi:ribosomal protein S18 acetylase RimI-like enzyme
VKLRLDKQVRTPIDHVGVCITPRSAAFAQFSSVRAVLHREVRMVDPGPDRERWFDLLVLADEPEPLAAVLDRGDLYGVTDDTTDEPLAAVLTLDHDEQTAELRVVAVAERYQGHGVGSWLVDEVCARLRRRRMRRVVVGTATSGVRQLAFYQRLGFRLSHVERDYFTPANGYPAGLSENGVATRDMAWMDRLLA